MFKLIVFLLPMLFGAPATDGPITETTSCQAPSWLQKTGQGSYSYSMEWEQVSGATGYEVWYTRGGYQSTSQTVSGTSHTFTNLVSGSYTFYVRTNCGSEMSSLIGNSDILEF